MTINGTRGLIPVTFPTGKCTQGKFLWINMSSCIFKKNIFSLLVISLQMCISGLNEFKEFLIFVENQGQNCYFQKLKYNTGIGTFFSSK